MAAPRPTLSTSVIRHAGITHATTSLRASGVAFVRGCGAGGRAGAYQFFGGTEMTNPTEQTTGRQILAFVERVERLEAEISDLNHDKAEVYAEAKGNGFDVRALKEIVSRRRKVARDPQGAEELAAAIELYEAAIEEAELRASVPSRACTRDAAPTNSDSAAIAEVKVNGRLADASGIEPAPSEPHAAPESDHRPASVGPDQASPAQSGSGAPLRGASTPVGQAVETFTGEGEDRSEEAGRPGMSREATPPRDAPKAGGEGDAFPRRSGMTLNEIRERDAKADEWEAYLQRRLMAAKATAIPFADSTRETVQ